MEGYRQDIDLYHKGPAALRTLSLNLLWITCLKQIKTNNLPLIQVQCFFAIVGMPVFALRESIPTMKTNYLAVDMKIRIGAMINEVE